MARRSSLKPRTTESMSLVIPVTQDASKDYWIPTARAQQLFKQGELAIDLTNYKDGQRVYCHTDGRPPYLKIT